MRNLIQCVLMLTALLSTTGAEDVVVYAQEGDTVTLKYSSSSQGNYLYWYFNNENKNRVELAWRNSYGMKGYNDVEGWQNRLSFSGDSLVIKNIQKNHFGTFVCVLKINGQTDTKTTYQLLRLTVEMVPPSPLLPGEPLNLACSVQTNNPEIHWLNPQGKMMNKGIIQKEASYEDHGQWNCAVKNEKNFSISVTVIDLSPPPPHFQFTSKTSGLTVPCSILPHVSWDQIKAKVKDIYWQFCPKSSSGCNNPQRLFSLSLINSTTWKPNEAKGLRPVEVKNGNLTLTKRKGTEDDRGEYMCVMEFKNSAVNVVPNRTVHVEFLKIIASPGTDLITGQQLNLTCKLDSPLPSGVNVKWTTPAGSSHPSLKSDHQPTHLIFPEVGTGDSGKWRCELWWGSEWLTSDDITLKIEPILSVWMLVIICSAAVIAILLLILTVILCRRRQRKMRHLRHRLCHCKNPKPKGFYRS